MAMHFSPRVAIVTGAGNGLGKAYALYLSKLGAKVVVNDTGGDRHGVGTQTGAADAVVREIQSLHGKDAAVPSYSSVEDGDTVVQAALDAFGRVDIVVNNAGILRDVTLKNMTKNDWDLVMRVHLNGTMSVTRAAWPHMREQKYGRIVNVSSASGLYGNIGQTNYAAAKMGIAGFTFTAAKEGSRSNIKVNVVAPLAMSRMTETIETASPHVLECLRPEFVAPFVGYLCHEDCAVSGHVYEVGAGWVSRVRWQRSNGVVISPNEMTLDAIAANLDKINAFEKEATYPQSLQDSIHACEKALKTSR
ncbi:hypothetical protein H310_05855 [Aphanomyces invadans]|uniref:Ketoreductase domain-containing protein n=1 Tax=Aphanomyces invadans TaxID=157072 RepID=A0A024U9L6_9STRA|nr:hypothetical protein H310_05855 [Aphanomyces invadans]ETW02308.1 hypothetical protein H310_05855 [Aphanomyces invadans]|eukprot:XP_008868913.1 hypothetical protein H310_05855 [Aphanomyces invadans]